MILHICPLKLLFSDGCAIAHAVSNYLREKTRCRTIFSTHYHELTSQFSETKGVLVYHMNILETPAEQQDEVCNAWKSSIPDKICLGTCWKTVFFQDDCDGPDIVFLYTVSSGPCSKSHGFNAAKLAGLPRSIIQVGKSVAHEFEVEQRNLMELSKVLNSQE